MYPEKRPTCVTVIGWAWIIIGGLMCLSAVMGFIMSFFMWFVLLKEEAERPFILLLFPVLCIAQVGVAVLGLVSGIHFLRFKLWARTVLEWLTWFLLVFVVGFSIFWIFMWAFQVRDHGSLPLMIMGLYGALSMIAVYGIPLAIMLRYLRGAKIKHVFRDAAEGASGAGNGIQGRIAPHHIL